MNKYFTNIKNPSVNELVYWLQVEFTDLTDAMKASNHNAVGNEPNPYHIEDTVWSHVMMVCLRAEIMDVQKINKICALLHDIGKPMSREEIPFEAKKPVHTESNEIRNEGKNDGKPSGLDKQKKYLDSAIDTYTDEELKVKYAKEYAEYLEEITN